MRRTPAPLQKLGVSRHPPGVGRKLRRWFVLGSRQWRAIVLASSVLVRK